MFRDGDRHIVETNKIGNLMNSVDDWLDGPSRTTYVVEVFAIAQWLSEPELVKARSAAHYELATKQRVVGDLDHETREDQVLFDGPIGG